MADDDLLKRKPPRTKGRLWRSFAVVAEGLKCNRDNKPAGSLKPRDRHAAWVAQKLFEKSR